MDGAIGPLPGKTLAEATAREEPSGSSTLYLRDYLRGNATESLLVACLHGARPMILLVPAAAALATGLFLGWVLNWDMG